MYLLNANTKKLKYFVGNNIPAYAILSHTWGDDEVSMHDILHDEHVALKKGFTKIHATCDQALKEDLHWAWIDTCCIDKTSSAELSEAINSMFEWYRCSQICYAFLEDIEQRGSDHYLCSSGAEGSEVCVEHIMSSRWFTRGWTLQELIAPKTLKFFDRNWVCLGTRKDFPTISESTGIHSKVLTQDSHKSSDVRDFLSSISIATRMSWASKRETTRIEDTAYCLLGLLGVNMPLLYGEGSRAFVRLQEQIISTSTDQSIFAWTPKSRGDAYKLLASSPACFGDAAGVEIRQGAFNTRPYQLTHAGLRITAPYLEHPWGLGVNLIILDCHRNGMPVALMLDEIRKPGRQRTDRQYEIYRDSDLMCVAPHGVRDAQDVDVLVTQPRKQRNQTSCLYFRLHNRDCTAVLQVLDARPQEAWVYSSPSFQTRPDDRFIEDTMVAQISLAALSIPVTPGPGAVMRVKHLNQNINICIQYTQSDNRGPVILVASSGCKESKDSFKNLPELPMYTTLALDNGATMLAKFGMDDLVNIENPALEIIIDPPEPQETYGKTVTELADARAAYTKSSEEGAINIDSSTAPFARRSAPAGGTLMPKAAKVSSQKRKTWLGR